MKSNAKRPEPGAEPLEIQKYFLATTSRSVVLEIQNMSDTFFKIQDSLLIHGDTLINPLPETILPNSSFTIGHGSYGFMTGCEGWAKYIEKGGIMMKIHWMVEYIGNSSITVDINSFTYEKQEITEHSTSNNIMQRLIINNPKDKSYLFNMLY